MDVGLVVKIIFSVIGGLGIFLLGMKNMSEGMQAVAGERLRKLISAITNNRILACGVGTAVTMIIQSSSITTVMVVGMVNAGLMTLMQAIGVVLGANIGTTITGWILALKIDKYGLPMLGIAAIVYLFSKKDKLKFTASFFVGLGMVFFGLELMKNGFSPLAKMPEFINWFAAFQPTSYFGVLKCVLVGAGLTAIVQSSSATLGITIGLATTGVIDFTTAAALVLGENIGTTITAYLASIGASVNAKRASYAHMMVNILGVAWITAIFGVYIKGVVWVLDIDPGATVYSESGTSYPYAAEAIAAVHTGFNVINVIVFLPLIGLLSKLLIKMVPDKEHEEVTHLKYLDVRMLSTPSISIEQSDKEIQLMGQHCVKMMNMLRDIYAGPDREKEVKIFNRENILDVVQKEITEFLGSMMKGIVSQEVVYRLRSQLRMADEYESISDYVTAILKLLLKLRHSGDDIIDEAKVEVLDLHDSVAKYLEFINEAVATHNEDVMSKARTMGSAVTFKMKEYREKHLARVATGQTPPLKSLIYTDMLNSYRRIKDHAFNIAEVLGGEK